MADANGQKKTRRASGPRQQRPVFAVVTYKDSEGNSIQLDKNNLNIAIERDSAKLVEMLTGEGFGGAAVVRVELPQPTARAKPETAGAA